MPNTTAPSRAAPSFPHHNHDNARHPHSVTPRSSVTPMPSVTSSGATTNEWDVLRCLLNASVKQTGEAGRHISQRLHAFKLVNYSPLAAEMRIERIDHAVALVGEQWLSTLTFAHALAQHLRNGRVDKESDEAVLQVWQQAIFHADACELLCRVTLTSSSHLGWLCGLLMGAAEIDSRLQQSQAGVVGDPRVRRQGALLSELSQLIARLDVGKELGLPSASDKPHGPWCALSAAAELTPIESTSSWSHAALASIQPLVWPEPLSEVLARRIAELEPISCAFANCLWFHNA